MQKLLPTFLLFLLVSCASVKTVPLKGAYLDKPSIIISENNKDLVWDKLIDFFAQKGMSIKIIDRSSGLIISEEIGLIWSYEDKKGVIKKPNAFVVIPLMHVAGTPINPSSVTAEWNVRIKTAENNKTSINVNLVNIKRHDPDGRSFITKSTTGVSTGKFEETIASFIK